MNPVISKRIGNREEKRRAHTHMHINTSGSLYPSARNVRFKILRGKGRCLFPHPAKKYKIFVKMHSLHWVAYCALLLFLPAFSFFLSVSISLYIVVSLQTHPIALYFQIVKHPSSFASILWLLCPDLCITLLFGSSRGVAPWHARY